MTNQKYQQEKKEHQGRIENLIRLTEKFEKIKAEQEAKNKLLKK
tara:strand:+ start:10867 stop:10998 length:132 start_codon:yes stop_codon:yes gene_type:complete